MKCWDTEGIIINFENGWEVGTHILLTNGLQYQ